MPQNTTNEYKDNLGPVPVFAAALGHDMPLTFSQYMSEVPGDMKVSVTPAALKFSSKSIKRLIRRNAIIANHTLNPPLRDGLLSVATYYQILNDMANNYERTHQDAWFEAYPQALLRSDAEIQALPEPTTSYLKSNRRRFIKRLAHYYWHYSNFTKELSASLANMLILTRLDGNEWTKAIASAVRWSWVNARTNLYARFPKFNGDEDFIFGNTRFAVGASTYGANIVSFPQWNVSVMGNMGASTQFIEQGLTTYGSQKDTVESLDYNPDSSTPDESEAQNLLLNMFNTIEQYGSGGHYGETDVYCPSRTYIENGLTLGYTSTDASSHGGLDDVHPAILARLNVNRESVAPRAISIANGNLTSRAWNNYLFYQKYGVINFSEMLDPNNDIYVIARDLLKIVVPSKSVEDCLKMIRGLPNVTMESLSKLMTYKHANQPTTATIVRWSPLVYETTSDGTPYARGSKFESNFERYDVDNSSISLMLHWAKDWPTLTPTVFPFASAAHSEGTPDSEKFNIQPFVLNSLPTMGNEFDFELDRRIVDPVGKFATMLDMISSSNTSPEDARVEGIGVGSEWFKSYIQAGSAMVFEEDPSTLRVPVAPLIDCTDPYQCGFNVVIAADDPNYNEWERYFTESGNFDFTTGNEGLPVARVDQVPTITTTVGEFEYATPVNPSYGITGWDETKSRPIYGRAHTTNSKYLDIMRHAFVFVGGAIFSHPWLTSAYKTAGNPIHDYSDLMQGSQSLQQWKNFDMDMRNAAFDPTMHDTTAPQAQQAEGWIIDRAAAYAYYSEDQAHPNTRNGNPLDEISIACYLYGRSSNTQNPFHVCNMALFLFAPDYGAVMPITFQSSMANLQPVALAINDGSRYMPALTAIDPKVARIMPRYDGSFQDYDRLDLYTKLRTSEWWLPFLKTAYYRPSSVGQYGVVDIYEDPIAPIEFMSQAKYVAASLATVIGMFSGIEDTIPFWSKSRFDREKQLLIGNNQLAGRAESTSMMPENGIISAPRVAKTYDNQSKFSANAPSNKFDEASAAKNAREFLGVSDGSTASDSSTPKSNVRGDGGAPSETKRTDKPRTTSHHRGKRPNGNRAKRSASPLPDFNDHQVVSPDRDAKLRSGDDSASSATVKIAETAEKKPTDSLSVVN